MRIGIDLDNTLICYDRAFVLVAKEEGLLPPDFAGGKLAVKARLLEARPDGYLWERLQGLVYGRRIEHASLFEGVERFLALCWVRPAVSVVIVSHKTELAHHDPQRTNLRSAALGWLDARGFFAESGFGLDRREVYFEATRDEKVARVTATGCDVFVDDLPEVLLHPGMPAACRKILFAEASHDGLERYGSWHEICDAVFPAS
jgi:hypothetical protein